MSFCGESQVVVNTSQRKPTLLGGCSTRRPAQRVERTLVAAVGVGEIHGQVPGSAIEDRAKFSSESLRSGVIEITPQDHASIPGATPHGDNCQLSRISHRVLPVDTHWSVPPGSGAARRTGSARHHPPIDTRRVKRAADLVEPVSLRIMRIHIIRNRGRLIACTIGPLQGLPEPRRSQAK
jgi:hypothetical protein